MAKPTMKAFEKSKFDKAPKGAKEGSKAEKKADVKPFAAFQKAGKTAAPGKGKPAKGANPFANLKKGK